MFEIAAEIAAALNATRDLPGRRSYPWTTTGIGESFFVAGRNEHSRKSIYNAAKNKCIPVRIVKATENSIAGFRVTRLPTDAKVIRALQKGALKPA